MALEQYKELIKDIGKAALHTLFPKDFEAYFCSLELVDSQDRTVDFFVFPIMPESINETSTSNTNIKKTMGGVTSISCTTFIPIDITLNGNFGRRFKFLVGREMVDAAALNFSTQGGSFSKEGAQNNGPLSLKVNNFSTQLKTGYGCYKILEAICDKSGALDSYGNPYRLFFYNPSLGNNYLVKVLNFIKTQSMDKNMIWSYTVQLKGLAPLDGLRGADSKGLSKTMAFGAISKQLDNTVGVIRKQIK